MLKRLPTALRPLLCSCPAPATSWCWHCCLRPLPAVADYHGSHGCTTGRMSPPEAVCAAHACTSSMQAPVAAPTPSASSEEAPSSSGGAARMARPKSARRQAAEALLHRRFSSSSLAALATASSPCSDPAGHPSKRQRMDEQQHHTEQQQADQQLQLLQRPPVRVAACSDCDCSQAAPAVEGPAPCPSSSAAAVAAVAEAAWCAQDVALPPMDWPAVLQSVRAESDVRLDEATHAHMLPGGIRAHLVCRPDQLPAALRALRASMQDSCVAIDLEWKPEGWAGAGASRVALMQLASATLAVLVRVNQLGFNMPHALRSFLSDRSLTFVGFSWDGADEGKMQQTFGTGRALFSRFIDLQQVGESLGYHGLGLGALTRQVLGFQPPKDRKVTMSNWETRTLSAKQIQYAALDAIITGHLYRGLRLWHASPSACTACRQMLGMVLPLPDWHCKDCERSFSSRAALHSHRQQKQHRTSPGVCQECGRVHASAC